MRIGNWIRVGSGNYEKYITDRRYRATCGAIKYFTACKNHPTELKLIHYHVISLSANYVMGEQFPYEQEKLILYLTNLRRL